MDGVQGSRPRLAQGAHEGVRVVRLLQERLTGRRLRFQGGQCPVASLTGAGDFTLAGLGLGDQCFEFFPHRAGLALAALLLDVQGVSLTARIPARPVQAAGPFRHRRELDTHRGQVRLEDIALGGQDGKLLGFGGLRLVSPRRFGPAGGEDQGRLGGVFARLGQCCLGDLDPARACRPRLVRPSRLLGGPLRPPLGVSLCALRGLLGGLRLRQSALGGFTRGFGISEFGLTSFQLALPVLALGLARRDLCLAAQNVRRAPALAPAGQGAGGQNDLAGPGHDPVPALRRRGSTQGVVQGLADEDAAQQDLQGGPKLRLERDQIEGGPQDAGEVEGAAHVQGVPARTHPVERQEGRPAGPVLMEKGDGGLGSVLGVGDDVLEASGQRGLKGRLEAGRGLERVSDDGEVAGQRAALFGVEDGLDAREVAFLGGL